MCRGVMCFVLFVDSDFLAYWGEGGGGKSVS